MEPHIDRHQSMGKDYFFEDKVYGIIIEPDETGHLYFIKDETNRFPPLDSDPIYSLEEKRGTVFCLQGPYRKAPYFHGVSEVSKRRISITFRTVDFSS